MFRRSTSLYGNSLTWCGTITIIEAILEIPLTTIAPIICGSIYTWLSYNSLDFLDNAIAKKKGNPVDRDRLRTLFHAKNWCNCLQKPSVKFQWPFFESLCRIAEKWELESCKRVQAKSAQINTCCYCKAYIYTKFEYFLHFIFNYITFCQYSWQMSLRIFEAALSYAMTLINWLIDVNNLLWWDNSFQIPLSLRFLSQRSCSYPWEALVPGTWRI